MIKITAVATVLLGTGAAVTTVMPQPADVGPGDTRLCVETVMGDVSACAYGPVQATATPVPFAVPTAAPDLPTASQPDAI